MELRQLETFRVVAEMGSFTRAAAALDYVQSTVTTHIQALELELGVPLFARFGKGVRLTEAGKRVLLYAHKMLNLAAEMRTALASSDDHLTGTLTISAPETLCIYRLPQLLHEFRQRHPQVTLIFRPCRVADLRREVGEGLLDAAFVLEEPLHNAVLAVEPLLKEPLVIIAQPTHPMWNQPVVRPADLADESILLTELGCNYRNLFEHALIQDGVYPSRNLEFSSIEAIKQCVMAGMGIAILPKVAVANEIAQGRLIALSWFQPDLSVMSQIVWHPDRQQSPALAAFLEMARSAFAAQRDYAETPV